VRQAKLLLQPPERIGSLDRVQILTLDILDDGPLGGRLVIDIPNKGRHPFKPGRGRRTPTPLAGDQLEPPIGASGSHDDGLHHSGLADRRDQRFQRRR
jgi:hypothetical protein